MMNEATAFEPLLLWRWMCFRNCLTAEFLDHDGLRGLDGFILLNSLHSAVSIGASTACVTHRRSCLNSSDESWIKRLKTTVFQRWTLGDELETKQLSEMNLKSVSGLYQAYVSANHNESTWRRPCIYIHTQTRSRGDYNSRPSLILERKVLDQVR